MTTMEMESNFQEFIALCLGQLAKALIMVYSLFANSLDIFLYVFYEYFVYDLKTSKSPRESSFEAWLSCEGMLI